MTSDAASAGETLNAPPPAVSDAEAAELASSYFGITVSAVSPLTSERDQNLRLTDEAGRKWVMKLANPTEEPVVTDFQTKALCHALAMDPGLPLPHVRQCLTGEFIRPVPLSDGRTSALRVLSWVEGQPLVQAPQSSVQRRNLALCHARLTRAFQGFSHPGQHLWLQWDSSNIDRCAGLISDIEGEDNRARVAAVLEDFAQIAKPAMAGMRRQVIYNDLNFHNVLVDPAAPDQITGIIDFGDIVTAPMVNDLAVAASYQFGSTGDCQAAGEFIEAWTSALPLTEAEIALLPLLIEARLALTLLITFYRAHRYPENAPYILRNNQPARAALAVLRDRPAAENAAWIRSVTQSAERAA